MQYADTVLFSTAIFDSVKDEPFAGGIAILDSKIQYIGPRDETSKYIGPDTLVRDFGDCLISPGFCDGHAHIDGTGRKMFGVQVQGLENLKSEEECAAVIKKFAEDHPEVKRINSNAWLLPSWGENPTPPTKKSLDEAVPDRPVYIRGTDGHSMWMNSLAIEEVNVEQMIKEHPEYQAEWFLRDENGELTGVINEDPVIAINAFAETYTQEERGEFQRKVVKYYNSWGLTGISEVSPLKGEDVVPFYTALKDMDNKGELSVRFHMWHGMGPRNNDESVKDAEYVRDLKPFFNNDRMRIVGIKTITDGIPFCWTSASLEPYKDKPDQKGACLCTDECFKNWVAAINDLGFSVKAHCTGDAAVRLMLDCYEESQKRYPPGTFRNGIEHMDIVTDEDIPRFGQLGVVASVQPAHINMLQGLNWTRYGEHAKNEWNFRRLLDTGAHIAIGTDVPVIDCNPYFNLYSAVTRKDWDGTTHGPWSSGQEITLAEAIKGYTIGSAWASFADEIVGTLEVGKYADIVVSDKNLFAIPADDLKDCTAKCTIFEGKIVYEA